MSTRARSRPATKSYTARPHQRTAAPQPVRTWPIWLTGRHLPALLLLSTEAGHLAAALVEWPASPPRGGFHILAAAGFGLLAAGVYFGPIRLAAVLGIGLTLTVPTAWFVGATLGLPPYRDYPVLAAIALTALEVALAGLLSARRLAPPRTAGNHPRRADPQR